MLNIRKASHGELQKYYTLFEMDFDEKELISKLSMHRAMINGASELLIVSDSESRMDLAYALVLTKSMYGYVLLKYFGVLPWYKGHGVGIDAMRLVLKNYADRQGIIAELTDFGDEEPERMKKLRKFFARFGFIKVDSDYRIGGGDVELMVKPIKGIAEIEPVEHRIVKDFYNRVLSPFAMDKMIDIRPVAKKAE